LTTSQYNISKADQIKTLSLPHTTLTSPPQTNSQRSIPFMLVSISSSFSPTQSPYFRCQQLSSATPDGPHPIARGHVNLYFPSPRRPQPRLTPAPVSQTALCLKLPLLCGLRRLLPTLSVIATLIILVSVLLFPERSLRTLSLFPCSARAPPSSSRTCRNQFATSQVPQKDHADKFADFSRL